MGIPNGIADAGLQPNECSEKFIYYLDPWLGEKGTAYEAESYTCAPSTPTLEQLYATSDCNAGVGCIELYWTPGNELGYKEQWPIDHYRIHRYVTRPGVSVGMELYYQVPADQNSFLDTQIHLGNTYSYYIQAVGTDGHSYSKISNRINIHIPDSSDWEFYSFDYFEGR